TAGKYTYPKLPTGRSGWFQPAQIKPRLPMTAMAKPQAEDTAAACCILTPKPLRKGTVMVPPPIPKKLENTPIPPPQAVNTQGLGRFSGLLCSVFLRPLHNICADRNSIKIPNAAASNLPGNDDAIKAPPKAPIPTAGAMARAMDQRILPMRL